MWWKANKVVESQPDSFNLHFTVLHFGSLPSMLKWVSLAAFTLRLRIRQRYSRQATVLGHILSNNAGCERSFHCYSLLHANVLVVYSTSRKHWFSTSCSKLRNMNSWPSYGEHSREVNIQKFTDLMHETSSVGRDKCWCHGTNLVVSTAKTEVDCEMKNLSSSTTASLWLWYMKFFDLLKKIYLRLGTLPTRTFIFQFSLRYCHTKQHLETDCT